MTQGHAGPLAGAYQWDSGPGPKHLRTVTNCDMSCCNCDATASMKESLVSAALWWAEVRVKATTESPSKEVHCE